jgi:hypothetical protein
MHTARLTLILAAATATLAANTAPAAASYGWPVRPFHRQHPIRGYFGDPRVFPDGHGSSKRLLHFGVDVAARNGTPVYATISGTASIDPRHPDVVRVQSGAVTFEYWHVVPAIRSGRAIAYRTVVGHVEKPWAHVHFAERIGYTYLNPLRPGAMEPYRDDTRPTIRALRLSERRHRLDVEVDAYDTTPELVPAPWSDLPVTPALVEWRIHRPGRPGDWHVAADFRTALPTTAFAGIYDAATRQNHVRRPGTYRFVLAHGEALARGRYVVEVRVADTAGNAATAARRYTAP